MKMMKLSDTLLIVSGVNYKDVEYIDVDEQSETTRYYQLYMDIALFFVSEQDRDAFFSVYTRLAAEPVSLMGESNFLRDLRDYSFACGLNYNPYTQEKISAEKGSHIGAKEFGWAL